MTLAASGMVMAGFSQAGSISMNPAKGKKIAESPVKQELGNSFGPIKQIDAGLLNIGYAEAGPANGYPVILLHGWPYDIYSFVDVAPLLATKGNK
jgi:hypothetical protein